MKRTIKLTHAAPLSPADAFIQENQDRIRRLLPATMVSFQGGLMSITPEGTQYLAELALLATEEIIEGRMPGNAEHAAETRGEILKRYPCL